MSLLVPLGMGKDKHLENFSEPELEYNETSEIAAAVDVSTYGTDNKFRPVYINQEDQILQLSPEDAKRLLGFLQKAVVFLDEYKERSIQ